MLTIQGLVRAAARDEGSHRRRSVALVLRKVGLVRATTIRRLAA